MKNHKLQNENKSLQMLTCYDFQSAQMLNETEVDFLLVGDSLGNVMLGYDTTVPVRLEEMKIFSAAVKRGAPNKFIVADLPFGTYSTVEQGIQSATELFQYSQVESVKLEGAFPYQLELIQRLTQIGIPVMGHIGLTPQSVHELGGYYVHGKNEDSAKKLLEAAMNLQKAGVFAVVLECVKEEIATLITNELSIPTIGIGAGNKTDGQVLVLNDLLQLGPNRPPKFCTPIANLFKTKSELITNYLNKNQETAKANVQPSVH
ncbi:3-methyl-2-oxobutanoate hydroxymethyltransferase [Halobacteriovorax sp.]|uniref:3-methyl-2-oxobutanoate hydroxymethyltransferase n=1 Tax=Halobacteriovorax sp. TaxID=2020862 RepID=UPI0035695124